MDAEATVTTERPKGRRNWWKLAFFITLIAFEMAREIAVLSSAEGARPNSNALVIGDDSFARAEGSWRRIDGGGELVPGTVTIHCDAEAGECLEATVMIHDEHVFAPDIDRFQAQFVPGAVIYENDRPDCAKYSVRIDLRLKKAFAVRERKSDPKNPNCANMEPRIEMQLGNGTDLDRDFYGDHFVPLLRLLNAVL